MMKSFIRRLSAPGADSIMKKLVILACTLAISTAAFAAPAKNAPKAAKVAHYTGTIEKYDSATHMLTAKHDGKETTFTVSDKADVMKGKSKADASSLAASTGQTAKIDYVLAGTMKTAEKIEVAAARAAAPVKPVKK
jgi:phage baseplate assembly protein gpV